MRNKHLNVGPGGRRCNCCFPRPGSVERKLEFRRAKRKLEREAFRAEQTNQED